MATAPLLSAKTSVRPGLIMTADVPGLAGRSCGDWWQDGSAPGGACAGSPRRQAGKGGRRAKRMVRSRLRRSLVHAAVCALPITPELLLRQSLTQWWVYCSHGRRGTADEAAGSEGATAPTLSQAAPAPANAKVAPGASNVVPAPAFSPLAPRGPRTRPASQDERLRLQRASARLAGAAALLATLRADAPPAGASQAPQVQASAVVGPGAALAQPSAPGKALRGVPAPAPAVNHTGR